MCALAFPPAAAAAVQYAVDRAYAISRTQPTVVDDVKRLLSRGRSLARGLAADPLAALGTPGTSRLTVEVAQPHHSQRCHDCSRTKYHYHGPAYEVLLALQAFGIVDAPAFVTHYQPALHAIEPFVYAGIVDDDAYNLMRRGLQRWDDRRALPLLDGFAVRCEPTATRSGMSITVPFAYLAALAGNLYRMLEPRLVQYRHGYSAPSYGLTERAFSPAFSHSQARRIADQLGDALLPMPGAVTALSVRGDDQASHHVAPRMYDLAIARSTDGQRAILTFDQLPGSPLYGTALGLEQCALLALGLLDVFAVDFRLDAAVALLPDPHHVTRDTIFADARVGAVPVLLRAATPAPGFARQSGWHTEGDQSIWARNPDIARFAQLFAREGIDPQQYAVDVARRIRQAAGLRGHGAVEIHACGSGGTPCYFPVVGGRRWCMSNGDGTSMVQVFRLDYDKPERALCFLAHCPGQFFLLRYREDDHCSPGLLMLFDRDGTEVFRLAIDTAHDLAAMAYRDQPLRDLLARIPPASDSLHYIANVIGWNLDPATIPAEHLR